MMLIFINALFVKRMVDREDVDRMGVWDTWFSITLHGRRENEMAVKYGSKSGHGKGQGVPGGGRRNQNKGPCKTGTGPGYGKGGGRGAGKGRSK